MNKINEGISETKPLRKEEKKFRYEKWKNWIVIGLIALAFLCVAYWLIHKNDEKSVQTSQYTQTESELKIKRLLQEIEGVGEAEVAVCETEDGVKSVVVVCEGANDLRVIMTVREAVASALGTQEKSVKIYLKK